MKTGQPFKVVITLTLLVYTGIIRLIDKYIKLTYRVENCRKKQNINFRIGLSEFLDYWMLNPCYI